MSGSRNARALVVVYQEKVIAGNADAAASGDGISE